MACLDVIENLCTLYTCAGIFKQKEIVEKVKMVSKSHKLIKLINRKDFFLICLNMKIFLLNIELKMQKNRFVSSIYNDLLELAKIFFKKRSVEQLSQKIVLLFVSGSNSYRC